MTVGELMEILDAYVPDAEIRLASQPKWPFEYSIGEVVNVGDYIYIGEGEQIDYLDGEVSEALGWR